MASTQKFSTNLGLAALPEIPDQVLFAALLPLFNAIRALAGALDYWSGALQQDAELWSVLTPADTIHSQGPNRLYVQYSEAVALGEVVTLWNDAGTLKAKKAGGAVWAGDTRGYCSVIGGVLAPGDFGEVILFGLHPYITGATPGTLYYTSNVTSGLITATKPVTTGFHFQPIGFALRADRLFFCPSILVPLVDATSLAITVLTP